ncbi:hypothetical protein [Hydrogenophaga sp.]|uniref:hypothetical protein n=1 Tax=Hydrogenophaga sp. TaxID=1904254 RepID=UPI003F6AA6C1
MELDTPEGLHSWRYKVLMRMANKALAPLQPSNFDSCATRNFLDKATGFRDVDKPKVGIVGMRVDGCTVAAERLQALVGVLGLPVLGCLRDTQSDSYLTARRLTLFDAAPGWVANDLQPWKAICDGLDR